MENNNLPVELKDALLALSFTKRELELYSKQIESGFKPISPVLAEQMYNLYLEGYSCYEIAKQNKSLSEEDILHCRYKYKWDELKDNYIMDRQKQITERLLKSKMESVEYLVNLLSVTHKANKEQILKYIQTGKEEDKPKDLLLGPSGYKSVIEMIQKITGEDRQSKVQVDQNTNINIKGDTELLKKLLDPANAAKLLNHIAEDKKEQDS